MWVVVGISPRMMVADLGGGAAVRPAVVVGRRAVVQSLVRARLVVERHPAVDAGLRVGGAVVGVQVDFFVFQAAPQALDEHVVQAASAAVHGDPDGRGGSAGTTVELLPIEGADQAAEDADQDAANSDT